MCVVQHQAGEDEGINPVDEPSEGVVPGERSPLLDPGDSNRTSGEVANNRLTTPP